MGFQKTREKQYKSPDIKFFLNNPNKAIAILSQSDARKLIEKLNSSTEFFKGMEECNGRQDCPMIRTLATIQKNYPGTYSAFEEASDSSGKPIRPIVFHFSADQQNTANNLLNKHADLVIRATDALKKRHIDSTYTKAEEEALAAVNRTLSPAERNLLPTLCAVYDANPPYFAYLRDEAAKAQKEQAAQTSTAAAWPTVQWKTQKDYY
ncbi:MAG: hypothetical protein FWD15_03325 [Alphaproteobacteria bacterium]|nr:hypothetical protein [Alphaproteobacteria bacterium]